MCAGIPQENVVPWADGPRTTVQPPVDARTLWGREPFSWERGRRSGIFVEVGRARELDYTTPTVHDTAMAPVNWAAQIAAAALSQPVRCLNPLTPIEVEKFRDSMVQVAALAFAAIESLDRQRERNGKAFYERAKQPPVTRETPPSYQEC